MNHIKGLGLGIPVVDLKKSVEWYETYLGCELIAPITGIADLRLTPHQVITLFSPEGEEPGSYWYPGEDYKENPHNVISLEVEGFDAFFDKLNNGGVQVGEITGENSSCGRTFAFYDLDGNRFYAWEGYVTMLRLGDAVDNETLHNKLENSFRLPKNLYERTWESLYQLVKVDQIHPRITIGGWEKFQNRMPDEAKKIKAFLKKLQSDAPECTWQIRFI
jgi:catechol 2,3-dioxygenase-like lactoylglutathione lyase family enzyme